MPLPTKAEVQQFSPSGACSGAGQITLAAMTTAYQQADSTDLANWTNSLSDDPYGGYLLGGIADNVLNNGDTEVTTSVVNMLEAAKYFYSPDNPPPAQSLTLTEMISAFEAGSTADQHTFANLIVGSVTADGVAAMLADGAIAGGLSEATPSQLNAVLAEYGITVGDPQAAPVVNLQQWIQNIPPPSDVVTTPALPSLIAGLCVEWSAQIVFGPGQNSISLVYNPVTKCLEIIGTIYTGGQPGMDTSFTNQTTTSEVCLNGLPGRQTLTVPVGDQTSFAYLTFPLLQQLFLKLDQLLRCCEPCVDAVWINDGVQSGVWDSPVLSSQYYSYVRLTEHDLVVSIDAFANDPPWKRYGRLVWHTTSGNYDGGYIRYSGQIFQAPAAQTTGFSISLDRGVSMIVEHQQENAAQFPGS